MGVEGTVAELKERDAVEMWGTRSRSQHACQSGKRERDRDREVGMREIGNGKRE
jgi:hypothetical protein